MNDIISKNPLVKKIVAGDLNKEIIDLLFLKQLPFTEVEYLESLVFVLKDNEFKEQAKELLTAIPNSIKESYIQKREANPRVAYYILLESLSRSDLKIITKIIFNQALPLEFLIKIAKSGNQAMLEILIENQIKLIAYPEIMVEMEINPGTNNFIKGKINEIREFYLTEENPQEIFAEDIMEDVKEIESREDTEIEPQEADEEEDLELEMEIELEKKALTTLQRINEMSVSERVKLALTGSKTERMILVKDPNKMVALSVVESPKISVDEISIMIKNKSIPAEIISLIAKNREWTKNYLITLELIYNPKTPVNEALSFIKKLHDKDLNNITHDRNVNPVVRNLAQNFKKQKDRLKSN